jgi:hypothetical protein
MFWVVRFDISNNCFHREIIELHFKKAILLSTMNGDIEAEIFGRLIDPSNPTLSPEAAAAILHLNYAEADIVRTEELARKSNSGTLTDDEHRQLEGYVFVGDVLSMLKAKAQLSLRNRSPAA